MEEKEKKLSVADIFGVLWKYKFLILILAVVCAGYMYGKARFFTPDTYAADGMLYVRNLAADTYQTEAYVTQYDIESARTLSTSYIEALSSRSFLMDVSSRLNEKYSWQQISGMLSISTVNDTEFLRIRAYAGNDTDAYMVAKSAIECAKPKLQSVFKVGEVEVVDEPIMPNAPMGHGATKKGIMGFAVGAFFGIFLAFLFTALDRKVHSSIDLQERYQISILGEL